MTTSLAFYGSKALCVEAMPLLESSPGEVSRQESSLAYSGIEGFPFGSCSHVLSTYFGQHGIMSTSSLTMYFLCAGSTSTESAGGGVPVKQARMRNEAPETLEEHSSDSETQAESITGAGRERHSSPIDDYCATFVASRGGLAIAKEVSAHRTPSMLFPLVCPVTSIWVSATITQLWQPYSRWKTSLMQS